MRLLCNATSYGDPPGGAGLRASALLGALRALEPDWEIEFLLARDTPAGLVPHGCLSRRLAVSAGSRARRFLTLSLPVDGDVLLTDHYPVGPLPTVLTLHDCGRGAVRSRLLRRNATRAAVCVAVSEVVRAALAPDAVVVPNGVEVPAELPPSPMGEYVRVSDPGVAHKDVEVARAAAAAVGVRLLEVGRGAEWLEHADFMAHIAGARAVVVPSREEGFGMVPLEAMALCRPVVVSDIPAHREVCGEHAWYAPPGDVAGFVAALREALVGTPDRLSAAKAHARRFTWTAAADRLREAIRTVSAQSV
ncbi:MAG: glycosyltransferase [Planctomycetota bacterium]